MGFFHLFKVGPGTPTLVALQDHRIVTQADAVDPRPGCAFLALSCMSYLSLSFLACLCFSIPIYKWGQWYYFSRIEDVANVGHY